MSTTQTSTFNSYILMLPRWYPNIKDKADGNFIESHIRCIGEDRKVVVLFVKGLSNCDIEPPTITSTGNVTVYSGYFKNYTGFSGRLFNVLRYLFFQFTLYKRIKKEFGLPVVSHVHVMARTSMLGLWLQKTQKIPIVISEHWAGYYPESKKLSRFKRKIYAHLLNKANGLSCVSISLSEAIKQIGVKQEIEIIPNVVNQVFLNTSFKTPPTNRINILHVSNLIKDIKRVHVIIELLEKLSGEFNEIYLTVVGDGPERKNLEKQASEQVNLKNRIRFTGDIGQEQIASLLQETHFSVLFSKFETQSIVLIESIAMGVPVVAPAVGGIPEHFNDKGIIFEPDSEKALENAVRQMITDTRNYNKNEMREYARIHFSNQQVKDRFTTLYKSVSNKIDA